MQAWPARLSSRQPLDHVFSSTLCIVSEAGSPAGPSRASRACVAAADARAAPAGSGVLVGVAGNAVAEASAVGASVCVAAGAWDVGGSDVGPCGGATVTASEASSESPSQAITADARTSARETRIALAPPGRRAVESFTSRPPPPRTRPLPSSGRSGCAAIAPR